MWNRWGPLLVCFHDRGSVTLTLKYLLPCPSNKRIPEFIRTLSELRTSVCQAQGGVFLSLDGFGLPVPTKLP